MISRKAGKECDHELSPAFSSTQALAIVNGTPFPGKPEWYCTKCGTAGQLAFGEGQ